MGHPAAVATLLHREKDPVHIYIEDGVIQFLVIESSPRIPREAGIGEHNVKLALVPFDLREQAIEIGKFRYVSLYASYIASDLFYRPTQLRLPPSCDENIGACVHKLLRRCSGTCAGSDTAKHRMLPLFSTLLRISPDFRYDIVSRNLK